MFDEKAFRNFMLDGILTEEEYIFINLRAKKINVDTNKNLDIFGCFIKPIDSSIVIDFNLLVPIIKDLKSMLVNIHEYTHAMLLYRHINNGLELDKTEKIPRANEEKYLKKIKTI